MNARATGMGAFQEAEGGLAGFGKAMLAVGAVVATVVAGAALVSIDWAKQFQADLTLIHTQAGDTTADLGKIASGLEQMSTETATGPDELAKALYHVESAGFRGAQALDMVRQAAELAKIGGANLEDTTQAVVGSLAAFGDKGLTASQAVAILNATVGAGDMRMEGLASAMSTGILPAARTMGLGLTDVGAALATLTDNVTPPEEAATRLRMTFTQLGAPTAAAARELEKIGISGTELADDMRQPNGLLVAITDLKKHLDESGMSAVEQSQVIARAFGGGRSSAAIETLLSEYDRFKDKYAAINQGTKDFGQAWADTQQTVSFQTQQTEADIKDLGTIAGMALLPMVNGILGFAMPALQHFAVFMSGPGQQGLATFGNEVKSTGTTLIDLGKNFVSSKGFADVMGQAVKTFGPIFKDAQKMVDDFAKQHHADFVEIGNTVKQIMAEIEPLIMAVLKRIQEFWKDHGKQIMAIVSVAMGFILDLIKGVMHLIADIIKLVTDIINGDWHKVWQDVVQILKDALSTIWQLFLDLIQLVANLAKMAGDTANEVGTAIINAIVTAIEDGASAIWNALSGAVTGAFNQAKKDLGISSPSKKAYDELGAPIMQGAAGGITGNKHLVAGALADAMGFGSSAGTGASASSLTGALAGGGGIVFDFRGSQMMSDSDMEKLAGKLLPALGRLAVGSGINFRV